MEKLIKHTELQDTELVGYLDTMGLTKKLTDGEKRSFLEISKAFGLNPFKREIYCSKYGEGESAQATIIVGYEVYIKRAERTGQLDGWDVETVGTVEQKTLKAVITIYRKDRARPFKHEVYYSEYVQNKKDGTPNKFWKEKPITMIKKVAMAQGFRLYFSDELGGMPYIAEELPQHTEDVHAEEIKTVQRPKMTDEILQKVIAAITAGKEGAYERAVDNYELTQEQLTTINTLIS